MEIKKGIGVSPGVVISTAIVLDAEDLVIPKRTVPADQVAQEAERFAEAVDAAAAELTVLRDDFAGRFGKELGGIFDFHLGVLHDKTLLRAIDAEVTRNHATA